MKRNLVRLGFGLMAALFTAVPAFAQAPQQAEGGSLGKGLGLLGAIIGMGIAAGLCGLGQGRVAAAAHVESWLRAAAISLSTSVSWASRVANKRSIRACTSAMTSGCCTKAWS